MKKAKKETKNEKNSIEEEIATQLKKSFANNLKKDLDFEKTESEEEMEENLNALEFHQFMRQSEPREEKAPVLERIAASAPRPIFVGGMPQGTQDSEDQGENKINYVSSGSERNEPKYVESNQTQIYREPEHVNLSEMGRHRESPADINQGALFVRPEVRAEPRVEERPWEPQRVDFERTGRENPFEREKIKYEKYRPKIPK